MINYFPDYGFSLGMIQFDFTMIALSPQSCCGFFSVLGCRVSFLVSSRIFSFLGAGAGGGVGGVVDSSTVSCDFGVFVKSLSSLSFYSTILLANQQLFYPNS